MGLIPRILPAWYQTNPYLDPAGYRPVRPSVSACVRSLGAWHNESVNIWSHLVGAVCALALWVHESFSTHNPFLLVYLAGSFVVLSSSVVAHTMLCHSERVGRVCVQCDYVGISIFLLGYGLSVLHAATEVARGPYVLFLAYGAATVLASAYAVWQALFGTRFYCNTFIGRRLATFAAPLALAAAGVLHLTDDECIWISIRSAALIQIVGVSAYVSFFPERWFPRRFDTLGASHQIWHLAVLAGVLQHYLFLTRGS